MWLRSTCSSSSRAGWPSLTPSQAELTMPQDRNIKWDSACNTSMRLAMWSCSRLPETLIGLSKGAPPSANSVTARAIACWSKRRFFPLGPCMTRPAARTKSGSPQTLTLPSTRAEIPVSSDPRWAPHALHCLCTHRDRRTSAATCWGAPWRHAQPDVADRTHWHLPNASTLRLQAAREAAGICLHSRDHPMRASQEVRSLKSLTIQAFRGSRKRREMIEDGPLLTLDQPSI